MIPTPDGVNYLLALMHPTRTERALVWLAHRFWATHDDNACAVALQADMSHPWTCRIGSALSDQADRLARRRAHRGKVDRPEAWK